ncbi:MAG: DNA primase [Planctomycetaceae bacterium]|nr:DNA primase [Planctomycetaceae bacterium]
MVRGSLTEHFEVKERVRQATDIVDLIGGYGEMRRQGRNWVTRCPWHDDRRPSLQVNPARQSWKCWVCNVGGDVFSFLMKRENLDFPAALRLLADKAGIPIEALTSKKGGLNRDQKNSLFQAMQWAADLYHQHLLHSEEAEPARAYLRQRGLLPPAVEAFRIGFAPEQWSWLLERANAAGHAPTILKEIGLAQARENGGFYDFYRGRLIFPIFDVQNRAISLGGRVLPEIAEREEAMGRHAAKYINGPETSIYTKSDHLFGLNLVRGAVEKSRHLVIVEGYTDVMMAWQAGLQNVVAVQGTALNERHIRLIRRFADRVTLVLDGDEAGIRRTNDILNLFVAEDLDLRIMIPPEGLDPCDYLLKYSATHFVELLDRAEDALEYKIRVETTGFDPLRDTQRANQAVSNILNTIAQTPRSVVMARGERNLREQQLLARLASRFQVEPWSLTQRLNELRSSRDQQQRRWSSGDEPRSDVANTEQATVSWLDPRKWDWKRLEVLELLLLQPDFLELIVERVPLEWFSDRTSQSVYALYCGCYEDGVAADFAQISNRTDDPDLQNILVSLDELAQEKNTRSSVTVEDRLSTVLEWFYREEVKASQRQTRAQLEETTLNEDQELAQLQALIQMERQRQGIQSSPDGK